MQPAPTQSKRSVMQCDCATADRPGREAFQSACGGQAIMITGQAMPSSTLVLGSTYALKASRSAWGHETSGKVSNPGLASR